MKGSASFDSRFLTFDTVHQGLSPSSRVTKHLQKLQNARSRATRVHGEPLAAPERAGQAWGTHTAWCCVFPCSRRSRASSACLRNVPLSVRLQRPIPRRRWSVGTDGTHCWPQVMGSFDTILVVLGMLLQHASSTKQVLLTAPAQPARTQRSPTAGCAPWVAGGCGTLPFDVVSMAVEQQSSAASWWHAGARAVRHVPASVCRGARRGRARGQDGR